MKKDENEVDSLESLDDDVVVDLYFDFDFCWWSKKSQMKKVDRDHDDGARD
jgi:hypothetical protein